MSKPSNSSHPKQISRPPERRPSSRPSAPHDRPDDGYAFLAEPSAHGHTRTGDALAEMLAEEFLESATSAEESAGDERDELRVEEIGGPFTLTTDGEEFAPGMDESNPAEAEREPFPTTAHGSRY